MAGASVHDLGFHFPVPSSTSFLFAPVAMIPGPDDTTDTSTLASLGSRDALNLSRMRSTIRVHHGVFVLIDKAGPVGVHRPV